LGEGARSFAFRLTPFQLPFSQNWEKGLGDEGKPMPHSIGFEFGITIYVSSKILQRPLTIRIYTLKNIQYPLKYPIDPQKYVR
jgi:hypothetical protein